MSTWWNWFWGISEEGPKRRTTLPPDYARPTLFIYTYDRNSHPDPPVDVEFDITPEDVPEDASYQSSILSDDSLGENRELRILRSKAVKQINKRLTKLADEWETDRQLSLDMAGGNEDLYGDEVTGKGIMRSTIDVAGGSAPKLRVACLCGGSYHRRVAFGEMLAKYDWPAGWVVKLRHKDLPKSAGIAGSDTASVRTVARSLHYKREGNAA